MERVPPAIRATGGRLQADKIVRQRSSPKYTDATVQSRKPASSSQSPSLCPISLPAVSVNRDSKDDERSHASESSQSSTKTSTKARSKGLRTRRTSSAGTESSRNADEGRSSPVGTPTVPKGPVVYPHMENVPLAPPVSESSSRARPIGESPILPVPALLALGLQAGLFNAQVCFQSAE